MRRALSALVIATAALFVAAPAFADDEICKDAIKLQENRISDLKAAVAYDKKVEKELLEGAAVREKDADAKDEHAKKFKAAADKVSDADKKKAFLAFGKWMEAEAKTDRKFAKERKAAAAIIGKGWQEAEGAIDGHAKFLSNLRDKCGS